VNGGNNENSGKTPSTFDVIQERIDILYQIIAGNEFILSIFPENLLTLLLGYK
jgi:hypothetical protein